MTDIWVDTDFGFDDLWALLVMRHLGCTVAGVSLVAGNTPLAQVVANASAARDDYGFDWPIWQGAARPLLRTPETAERILGPTGMRSRGAQLSPPRAPAPPAGAVAALRGWLETAPQDERTVLALGPLANIAHLLQQSPDVAERMTRLVWMGGSAGAGNHTPTAEFNAFADPEALESVLGAGLQMDIVDLKFCRSVTFDQDDMPRTDTLTGDLLGGYLDIALTRGRSGMAIYDPLAALAVAAQGTIGFSDCTVSVSTEPGAEYGATRITMASGTPTRIATEAKADLARLCLDALEKDAVNGPRQ